MTRLEPTVELHPAARRGVTRSDGLDSRHSFSFGRHYEAGNTHFGVLLAHNEDRIAPGRGFDTHPHRDTEILTWVLAGSLVHQDSTGHSGVLRPGMVQRLSAGTGIQHSERNDPPGWAGRAPQPTRIVQMWVAPDRAGATPSCGQHDVNAALRTDELVPVASGLARHAADAVIGLGSRHAALHAARLRPGRSVVLPDAPWVHVFVSRGAVALEDVGELHPGDAARLTATGGRTITAVDAAEVLVWEMHAQLGP